MKETLNQYSDENLKAIITDAQNILDERDRKRKEDAMRQIRSIAAAHGLSIEAKKPGKKRGRPRKSSTGGPTDGT